MTRPNGISTNYSYDNLSRLLSVLHQAGVSTIDGATYTVDAAGNRTAKTDQRAGVTSNYSYDALYELTQVVQGSNTTESYTYDPVGNRLSSLGLSPYNYNVSNELTGTPSASYTYDSNGNLLTKVVGSNTTSYAWDFENRLTSVTLPGTGGTVSLKYDPFGRRIYKSSSSGTSTYAYDAENLIEEVDANGNAVARYVQTQNIDEPLAMLRSGAVSYYEGDGLGSITSLSNTTGALANTYTFDSFGNLTGSTGSINNPFRYTAREFDSETGLYHYRTRYLDTNVGRFLGEDPLQFNGGENFYSYVQNDPNDATDPDGMRTRVCCRRLLGVLGFITRKKHCYVFIDPEDGRPPLRLGLHKNITLNGVFYSGGHVFPNFDGDDRGIGADTVKNPDKDCKDVPGTTPCVEKQMYDNYQDAPCRACGSNYKFLGPNSNTFASDFVKNLGLVPPRMKGAPGYGKP